MTVLTKMKQLLRRPRCQCLNAQRQQCAFQGVEYINGKWCCRHHGAGKKK